MLELIDGRDSAAPVHIPRPRVPGAPTEVDRDAGAIVEDVRLRGDAALLEYTERLDGARLTPQELVVDPQDVATARELVRPEVVTALEVMAERLRRTCERQVPSSWRFEEAGEMVGELIRPLRRVGIYVPGGRAAYPSTVVMAAVPATVAGVEEIAVCTPPGAGGMVPEAVLAACSVAGVSEVYRMGGAHAVAALAYGTETVRPVDKIVGPGNVYVTTAKRIVRGWVGTDADAGPSEIVVVADDSVPAQVLAADLIAQAEHGPHGTHALITWVPEVAEAVMGALELEVGRHERADDVENALTEGGRAVLVRDLSHALDTANAFAPEHLQLAFDGAPECLEQVRSAGSVFVGVDSPVPVGDYVGGTNHVLPTGGSARFSSGLGAADFVTRVYVSSFDVSALERLAPHVDALADAEGLPGHGRAVRARLEKNTR